MASYNWGILATGNIANSMAEALGHVPGANLLAVASRNQTSATQFADKWKIPRAYGSYDALLADADVDIVYIATPNALHREHILACLAAGKHVLCEKPLTTSVQDSAECVAAAQSSGLFFMEAMWTAFFPAIEKARALIAEGAIGTPRHLTANFVAYRDPEKWPNLYDPALGGGAALDLGVYPITIAQLLAGPIKSVSAEILKGPSGVDEMVAIAARHENDVMSHLSVGFRCDMPVSAELIGDAGSLVIPHEFHHPESLIWTHDGTSETFSLPPVGMGYAHEAMEVQKCLDEGKTQSNIFPHDMSIRNAELIAALTAQ